MIAVQPPLTAQLVLSTNGHLSTTAPFLGRESLHWLLF